ncbi:MAG: hypothetical protein LQ352_005551 [Teloschistes flavicans]|nr:MAG: hypothetical protein LQ352_005551 [Teloschistes flavicans]
MADISKPLQNGFPWGTRTAARTNPYENSPTTAYTRSQLGRHNDRLNAHLPPSDLDQGDTFQINVHNQITGPEEGTALHCAQYAAGLAGRE